jgi:deoxyribonuclease-4
MPTPVKKPRIGAHTPTTGGMAKRSIAYAQEIGAEAIQVFASSPRTWAMPVEKAWKQIHEGMMPILNALGDDAPYLLLEPTAGQGQSLVKKLDDLEMYLKALEYHPKVGICLDTCHVFAAGHDISVKGGMSATIDLLVEVAGIERFQLVHANDSMDVCGALKDRHQNIGDGHIGVDPFKELLSHPAVANAPLILETPGMEPEHGKEVALLKKLRG